jgi:hypothetical protein
MRGSIIDAQGPRATSNIDAESLPREWLLEYALAEIASEEQGIRSLISESRKELNMGDANILRLVHHAKIERYLFGLRDCCRQRRK